MNNSIEKIRKFLSSTGAGAFVAFTDDEQGSEYVADHYKTREYISGFTGSAGTLVVLTGSAHLWTDGRYFIQAAQQLQGSGIDLMKIGEDGVPDIVSFLAERGITKIVCESKTCTAEFASHLRAKITDVEICDCGSLVDEIWQDRPPLPQSKARILPLKTVGQSSAEKIARLRAEIASQNCAYALVSAPDDVAWLYNLRGDDIAYNPVIYAFAIVGERENTLYVDESKLGDVAETLRKQGVTLKPYGSVYEDAKLLQGRVMLNSEHTNFALFGAVAESFSPQIFPVAAWKSRKNAAELAGMRRAHLLDGIAVVKFAYWLNKNVGKQPMTEISVSEKLEEFRKLSEEYIEPSFETICGYGEHGAIVHYSATPETDASIEAHGLLLVDSGGQYTCGTTDITRTFVLGKVSRECKRHFTLVLKSHIALASAKFPQNTAGGILDMLARSPLWAQNLNYRHGTGHGVGHILNVHEGPQRISVGRSADCLYGFDEGMVTSDEPGLYIEGQYGIRHENLTACVKDVKNEYGQFLKFETLTLVPFDLAGILPEMLTASEKHWLNTYHKRIYRKLSKYLSPAERRFLAKATREI